MNLVKIRFKCGEILFFSEKEWGIREDDNPSSFIEPTPRCQYCELGEKVDHEGKWSCPASVEHIEMTDEEVKENLVPVSGE